MGLCAGSVDSVGRLGCGRLGQALWCPCGPHRAPQGPLWGAGGPCGVLQSRCEPLWGATGPAVGCYGALWTRCGRWG